MFIQDQVVFEGKNQTVYCNIVSGHIRQINRATNKKPASILIGVSDSLAEKLIKDTLSYNPIIRELELRWCEQK